MLERKLELPEIFSDYNDIELSVRAIGAITYTRRAKKLPHQITFY